MLRNLIVFTFFISFGISWTQKKLSGEYQAIIYSDEKNYSDAQPVYFSMTVIKGLIDGKMRFETKNTSDFVITKLVGNVVESRNFQMQQVKVLKQSTTEKINCFQFISWQFNDSTGFFVGDMKPNKCGGSNFKIIAYKSEFEWHENKETIQGHQWVNRLIEDLKAGLSSPEKRKQELRQFAFQSVYFDYDKDSLKVIYHPYLLSVVKMVKSHSDLRIRLIGHTDSDGSDAYNIKLSQRRTAAISKFLEENGLAKDRIVIDYKGEKIPVGNNKTEEGKRKNRRVDFEFI